MQLYRKNAGSGSKEELLLKSDKARYPDDWSPDGKTLIFDEYVNRGDGRALPMEGERKPYDVISTPFRDMRGRLSPDGKWIVYESDESGSRQVYLQSFPPSGGKWQVSTGGGSEPQWRKDGRELNYRCGSLIMAVEISTAGIVEISAPRKLFEFRWSASGSKVNYVPSGDGKRFLVNVYAGDNASTPITVVLNWMAALK